MDVYYCCEYFFGLYGCIFEEEVFFCIVLLIGYNVIIYNYGDKEDKI